MAGLAAKLASYGVVAWTVRSALFPNWRGAPARLIEVVLAISALTVIAQILGMVGLFGQRPLLIASISLAVLTRLLFVRFGSPITRYRDRTEVAPAKGLGAIA